MFYYIKNVEKSITLAPKDIGMKITDLLFERLCTQVEGSCTSQYGFIIAILSVEDCGEGVIDDSGNVVFAVKYNALTFKPDDNEVLDGIVREMTHNGFNVYVGPMQVFISKTHIPDEFFYSESPEKNFSDKKNTKIKDGSVVRFRLKSTIFKENKLFGVGTIADEYLGIIY